LRKPHLEALQVAK
jgi:hypothetical protein